jgi:hypothetical protein
MGTTFPPETIRGEGSHRVAGTAARFIGVQLIVSAAFFVLIHLFKMGVVGHFLHLGVSVGLGIYFSVAVLREWKREPEDPGIFPWMLAVLVVALVCIVLDGTDCFVYEIYGGKFSSVSIVEGFNFSVQTVTTVGYGNWPYATKDPAPVFAMEQIMELRKYCIFLMAAGATIFTLLVGMTTTWLLKI